MSKRYAWNDVAFALAKVAFDSNESDVHDVRWKLKLDQNLNLTLIVRSNWKSFALVAIDRQLPMESNRQAIDKPT